MKESRGILLIAIGWFRLIMGNSLGCSASGERLVSAARDGDVVEARMLLDINPSLARYSTFGGLNSPLHFAAAKGHNEIASMLLENGADVNSRNYCGQTALMHACRHGHWEVVQTLLLYKSNVIRADYFSGRTALHFAAVNGHVRCLRLVLADFIPSGEIEFMSSGSSVDDDKSNTSKPKFDKNALTKFVNKAADGGITTLHIAALNGYFDCVQLLLDINASVSATTFHYGTSMDLIGTGSTPLHYAACGGNLKCCQMLLAKGANKLALNCNGWLPADVARMWGRHWLEPLLAPNSSIALPTFPPSNYLCLPLMSIMSIAREFGLQATAASSDDSDQCSVCLERACSVAATGCGHEFCVKCALYLCSSTNVVSDNVTQPGSIPCPLCRNSILSFIKLPSSPKKELTLSRSLSFCAPCMLHGPGSTPPPASVCRSDFRKNRVAAVSSDFLCPVSCSPFPSMTMPLCTCNDDPCPPPGAIDSDNGSEDPRPSSESVAPEQPDFDGRLVGETSCSKLFWHRRSSHREQQCNSEINV